MKIRVIVPFRDVALNNKVIRAVGDIIDTDKPEFKCTLELAQERIRRGFCEEINEPLEALKEAIDGLKEEKVEKAPEKPKKGKKVSKKK